MKLTRAKERQYIRTHLKNVRHITIDPRGPGVIRLHLIPADSIWSRSVPYLLLINGQYIYPIGISWAILLSCLIEQLETTSGKFINRDEYNQLLTDAVNETAKIYPSMRKSDIRGELKRLVEAIKTIASGEKSAVRSRHALTIGDYAKYMKAPHRMDLMISPMTRDGIWCCNQKCLHCYAAGQEGGNAPELSTDEWKSVIDKCRLLNIPQLTFTGGEPTLNPDLPKLVKHAEWFVTRLNTNGRLLTPKLCEKLFDASLDNLQITLYSSDESIHNKLVGDDGFKETVQGIKNALAAGLECSVNTPLCSINQDYIQTLEFLHGIGIKYVTCSGLIPQGGALTDNSKGTRLSGETFEDLLGKACSFCKQNDMEISFTSPGVLSPDRLASTGIKDIPLCGACLSNMAVRPDGEVVPCQSWLSGKGIGNILTDKWSGIWNSAECRRIRKINADGECSCQLNSGVCR